MAVTETENRFLEQDDAFLRPVEKEDVEFLRDLVQHPEVRNTIGRLPRPVNLAQEEDYLEEMAEDDSTAYFLVVFQGERAGTISLHGVQDDYRRGEFGISIDPKYHNRGIGTKAVKMMLKYAFETLNMHKVRGGYLEHNPASRRVMEKAGFQEEGTERDYKYVDGEWKNVIWMSILEDEYYG